MTTACGQNKKLIFDSPPQKKVETSSERAPTPPSPLPFELQDWLRDFFSIRSYADVSDNFFHVNLKSSLF